MLSNRIILQGYFSVFKMTFKVVSVLTVLTVIFGEDLLSKFHQNDYDIKDVRVVLDTYDPRVFKFLNVTTYKHNRTTPAINASWSYVIDLHDKTEVIVQGYKFASNEFRTFPIRFQVSVVKAYKANVIGLQTAEKKCGYLNGTYFIKDIFYYFCTFVVDQSRLPPLIPSGLFKFALTFTNLHYEDNASVNLYFEIYRQIIPPKSKQQQQ